MSTKTICVLANSIKFSGRCIAGMELRVEGSDLRLTQNWVRPISLRDGGEVNQIESALPNKPNTNQPAILDVIDVPVQRPANVAGQPEDWLIDPSKRWAFRNVIPSNQLENLVQTPTNLWLEDHSRRDRVSPEYLRANSLPSLYLIDAEDFTIEITEAQDFNSGQMKKKRRSKFQYNGTPYDLALTDPLMQKKYFPTFPNLNTGIITPGPPHGCRLCISLAPVLNGYHYKLVAAVI